MRRGRGVERQKEGGREKETEIERERERERESEKGGREREGRSDCISYMSCGIG